jgi:hypothetical protein
MENLRWRLQAPERFLRKNPLALVAASALLAVGFLIGSTLEQNQGQIAPVVKNFPISKRA